MDTKKATNLMLALLVGAVGMLALCLVNYTYMVVRNDFLATAIVFVIDTVAFFYLAKWMFRRTTSVPVTAIGLAIGTVLPLLILLVGLNAADFVANTSVGFAIPFVPWVGIVAAYLSTRQRVQA